MFNLTFKKIAAGSYKAIDGNIHVEIDNTGEEYLGWQVFISEREMDGDEIVTINNIVRTFAQTYREAKEEAEVLVVDHKFYGLITNGQFAV